MPLDRVIRWRPAEGSGLEQAHIREWSDEIRVRSVLIGTRDTQPFGLFYDLLLDPGWTFRSILIQRTDGVVAVLTSDGKGKWFGNQSEPLPHLDGCIDVDFEGTPLTNTLPIRRTQLIKDQPQRFDMAWIPLDTLEARRDGQIYTRRDDTRIHYAAADASFEAELTVDEDGFVVHYPGLFERG